MLKGYAGIVGMLLLALMGLRVGAQPCAVSLGPDTSMCAVAYTIHPAISVSMHADSLRIVYDATQGQSGLGGATKVYMHAGAELVPFGGWQHVVGNWGQDDGVGQMTSLGNNLWTITIQAQAYFGLAAGTSLNGIFMVFRNADGSQTGKDNNNNDIWMDMTQAQPTSAFAGVTGERLEDALAGIVWSDGSQDTSLTVNAPGTYWIQVTDTGGCVSRDTIVVNMGQAPIVDLGQPAICDGQAVVLDPGAGYASYAWSTGDTTQTLTVSSAGTYIVTVTNAQGCEGIDIVNVPTGTSPSAGFTFAPGQGVNGVFTNTSTGASTYAWDFDGDGQIDSQSSNTTHTWVYASSGTYTPTLVVTNVCGSDTFSLTVQVGIVGVEEGLAGGFVMAPNPSTGMVHVKGSLLQSAPMGVVVTDVRGHVVHALAPVGSMVDFVATLDLSGLPSGLYFVSLERQGQRYVQRLSLVRP